MGRRRPPGGAGIRLALPILVAVSGVAVAAVLWQVRRSPERPPAPAPTPAAVTVANESPPVAEATRPAEIPLEDTLRQAPLLTPEAARALLEDAHRRGGEIERPLDTTLHVAGVGFRSMDRVTLNELSGLFALLWTGRPADEERRMRAYVQYARTGDLSPLSELEAGRELFVEAIRSLRPTSRERLGRLVEMAIVVGLRSQRESEERARHAAANPVLLPGVPAAPKDAAADAGRAEPADTSIRQARPTRTAGTGVVARSRAERKRKEAYWRRRAASARAAVDSAEARLDELEERARRLGPYIPGPDLPACQTGTPVGMGRGVIALRDDSVGAITCDGEVLRIKEARKVNAQVEQARRNLARRKQAVDDLAEEARRAGALPGWLR